MGSTNIETKSNAPTRQAITKAVKPEHRTALGEALSTLDLAVQGERSASMATGYARVAVGAALLPVQKALLALDGWTAGDVAEHILKTYFAERADANGQPYSWSTVEAWTAAADVESTLDPKDRGKFNSDSLRVIRRVKQGEKGDYSDRRKFASELVKKDATTVSAVRAAYDTKFGKSDRSSKESNPAADAAKLVEKFGKNFGPAKGSLKRNGIAYNTIASAVMMAATFGQANPKADPEALGIALRVMLTPKA